jgi:hypothetical protein
MRDELRGQYRLISKRVLNRRFGLSSKRRTSWAAFSRIWVAILVTEGQVYWPKILYWLTAGRHSLVLLERLRQECIASEPIALHAVNFTSAFAIPACTIPQDRKATTLWRKMLKQVIVVGIKRGEDERKETGERSRIGTSF